MFRTLRLFLLSLLFIAPTVYLINRDFRFDKKFDFYPSDWFYYQRAYPGTVVPEEKYHQAIEMRNAMEMALRGSPIPDWEQAGPSNIGGRIPALAVNPLNTDHILAGSAAGGVFLSTNGGTSWTPKTDFFGSLSIGALRMDPNNPNIVYCGTGESNNSTDAYAGIGMLKSSDGGHTWSHSGLDSTRHIGAIEVHPMNSNLIFVAAAGGLYSKGPHRGVYRSTDAGATWERVFHLNDSTSVTDVAIDAQNPSIVYAATYERLRGPSFRKAAGIASGVYKSTDGGNTWTRLANGLPAPSNTTGRISIAVSKSNPNYVYALFKKASAANGSDNTFSGFYRSTDKGANWTKMPNDILSGELSNFGWYFGLLEVSPSDHNSVYIGDVDLLYSANGGNNWTNITNSYSGSGTFVEQHPDMHSLWIDPNNSNLLINGNDGGVFISENNGGSWTKCYDLPVSQFYASAIDYLNPERLIGGTQDNGTLYGRTGNAFDWEMIYGGDGFHSHVDYTNSNIIYAEYQFAGLSKSTNGGVSFSDLTNGLDLARTNWSTPYMLDPKIPGRLYLGSYKMHVLQSGSNTWTAISGDLTRGANGRLGTITAISVAPDGDNRVLYVGTDDAKLSVSTNNGGSWSDVTGTLPRRYITDVVADTSNPAVCYVTVSGYNLDETNAHIFRTTNYGQNWTSISGNMPDVPVNSLVIDYSRQNTLFVGCDAGVFYTTDLGTTWKVLGAGLPNSPVFDVNLHLPTMTLVAGTHGRSMFRIDVSVLTGVKEEKGNTPDGFGISSNYPNPFNPSTTIVYSLDKGSSVSLELYDITGTLIALLDEGYRGAGTHRFNYRTQGESSGVYFVKLTAGNQTSIRKIILMK